MTGFGFISIVKLTENAKIVKCNLHIQKYESYLLALKFYVDKLLIIKMNNPTMDCH